MNPKKINKKGPVTHKHLFTFFIAFLALLSPDAHAGAPPHIFYKVSFTSPQTHELSVELTITGIHQPRLLLEMPVWAPGSYLVREFSRNIISMTAESSHAHLAITHVSKNEWSVPTSGVHEVTVNYTIYAFERSVQNSFVDISHAFLSNPGIFIYPSDRLTSPSIIQIIPFKTWTTVSTSLVQMKGSPNTFFAADYDTLFDSPFEIGNQNLVNFNVGKTHYQLAIYGSANYNKERMVKDLTRLIETQNAVFGANPNLNYLFILHNFQTLTGDGLEHLKSSVVELSRNMFIDSALYHVFLNVMAHEHFHLWNGKRLRPIALGPFNYERENYTTDLWIVEGFTRYYENATVERTKLFSTNDYLHELSQNISYVVNQAGREYQSLADASFDAWIKLYRHNENSDNSTINYYNQGALIAMLLDLQIIHDTGGEYRLDDAIKYMYRQYYQKLHRGYTDGEFRAGLQRFTKSNLRNFYKAYVSGTNQIDIDHYLNFVGYRLVDENEGTNNPWIGASTATVSGTLKITGLARNSSFYLAGLNVDDILISIDHIPVTDLQEALKDKKPGDEIMVAALRDGLPITFKVSLLRRPFKRYHLESMDTLTQGQIAARKKWLD